MRNDFSVIESRPGEVGDPYNDKEVSIRQHVDSETKFLFHSHASGFRGVKGLIYSWGKEPSPGDKTSAGARTDIAFLRHGSKDGNGGMVIFYNQNGEVARMKGSAFLKY